MHTLHPEQKDIRVVILDTHPVQYRAPIYAALAKRRGLSVHVLYYSDHSMHDYFDDDFGRPITWDIPLLEGYPYSVLASGRRSMPRGFFGLRKGNVARQIRRLRPDLLIVHSLNYWLSFRFVIHALFHRDIVLALRVETQDEAFAPRPRLRSLLRSAIYAVCYSAFKIVFCFGELNRRHLLAHGVSAAKLRYSHFSTPNQAVVLPIPERRRRRDEKREALDIGTEDLVVGFFGKLIAQKDPELFLRGAALMGEQSGRPVTCLVVGSGALEGDLRHLAASLACIRVIFVGFVNQSQLVDYYLATDIVVLPSRGDVWGLVVNEALQAGCAVAMSDAVGAAAEFGSLERAGTFRVGDAEGLARTLERLSEFPRSFTWAENTMELYSTEAAADAIAEAALSLQKGRPISRGRS